MINAPLFYHISWHDNDIFNTNHIITCPWPINETGPNKCKWLPLGARSHQVPQSQGPVLRLRWGRWQGLLQAAEVVPESSSEEVGGECAGGFQRGRIERAPGLGRQLGVRKGRDAHAAQLPGLRAFTLGFASYITKCIEENFKFSQDDITAIRKRITYDLMYAMREL